ncbi:MAG: HEAT repeat domain-containing protein [Candidatus Nanopelagicales bacterium]
MSGFLAGAQLAVFSAAVATLLGAVCWRQVQRMRTARWFRARLHDPDPAVRCAAVDGWIAYGLHRSAKDLLALTTREEDPAVLQTVALAVRRRAWEPPSRPQITELRAWGSRWDGMHPPNDQIGRGRSGSVD